MYSHKIDTSSVLQGFYVEHFKNQLRNVCAWVLGLTYYSHHDSSPRAHISIHLQHIIESKYGYDKFIS